MTSTPMVPGVATGPVPTIVSLPSEKAGTLEEERGWSSGHGYAIEAPWRAWDVLAGGRL